jgi:hypothetical protein
MATISKVQTISDGDVTVFWETLTTTNADGEAFKADDYDTIIAQAYGTWGTGGTLKIQGSIDGTNWFDLPLKFIGASSVAVTATNPAAAAAMTFAAGTIDTGTDMTAAEAAAIVTDLAALKTAVDANNAQVDALVVDVTALKAAMGAVASASLTADGVVTAQQRVPFLRPYVSAGDGSTDVDVKLWASKKN